MMCARVWCCAPQVVSNEQHRGAERAERRELEIHKTATRASKLAPVLAHVNLFLGRGTHQIDLLTSVSVFKTDLACDEVAC